MLATTHKKLLKGKLEPGNPLELRFGDATVDDAGRCDDGDDEGDEEGALLILFF